MTFCKYSFPSQTIWENHKNLAENCAVVEIGDVSQDGYYAVDILWYGDIPASINEYEVFPDPVGVHTFSGQEQLYKERFCQFNPGSPYCEVI